MECADILELRQEERSYSDRTDDETKNDIPRATSSELTYNEFFWRFMKRNQPVVITNVSTDWECMKWTHLEDQKKQPALINNNNETVNINYNYLMEQIKNIDVPIADCNTLFYNSHKKLEMKFYDFLRHWQETRKKDADVLNSNDETRATSDDLLYLKDWHLQAQMPDYKFYVVPKHFAADWLNEYLIATKRDDYRFVYMGPRGTWTPFHADVFGSFSWSTNVAGIKKWLFLPPGEELKLQDKLGNLPLQIDIHTLDSKNIKHYILLQKEGEAIFVPSGWYHQVWNITDTISVNHNWFNACNLKRIWLNLASQMSKVIAEIQDCREMDNFDSHCQTMLRATFGINYLDFLDILEFIVEKRLATLKDANENIMSSNYLVFNKYQLNDFHTRYDLRSVNEVVHLMAEDSIISENRVSLYRRCMQLLELTKDI